MNKDFRQKVDALHPKFVELTQSTPYVRGAELPKKGVYLLREKGQAIYVGRSNDIHRRYGNHMQPRCRTSLGVLIAKKKLGIRSDYRPGSKKRLWGDRNFVREFWKAKKRIIRMEFRAVEENNSTQQALLEVYCAVVLKARYNDFDNH